LYRQIVNSQASITTGNRPARALLSCSAASCLWRSSASAGPHEALGSQPSSSQYSSQLSALSVPALRIPWGPFTDAPTGTDWPAALPAILSLHAARSAHSHTGKRQAGRVFLAISVPQMPPNFKRSLINAPPYPTCHSPTVFLYARMERKRPQLI
jgi:hypothetical protein